MSTLWGSKNSKNNDNDDHASERADNVNRPGSSSMRDPTERDRLLPDNNRRPPHADGYLDPDDPAVSPYNLWTVRFTRYLTILFLAVTFLWWVLLLVSIFVSPPGLHTRGSGFTDFAYACLTIGVLLTSLLFFSAPSLVMRVSQAILGLFLLADLIIIVAVTRIRAEEGPPGIAGVVWVTVITAWCIFVDRVVTWGKREEEERLTGRPETRRTLKEWLAILTATVILIVFIAISILMTATLVIRSLDAGLPMDGERYLVDDGKYRVHLACVGNVTTDVKGKKSPTVLLEGAGKPVEYDLEHWAYFAIQNGTIDRYCYWDRPGYAWSDNAPSPHSAGMSADSLAEALTLAGETGPFIVVSAGYGSIVSRIFSARHFRQVVGILLVDPLHEDFLNRMADTTRGFIIWGWGIISPLGLRRIIGSVFMGQTREDRVYGINSDEGGKYIKAKLQENLVANSLTKSELASARVIQDIDTPLAVVSSGKRIQQDEQWEEKQKDLTNITSNLLAWDIVNKAPHHVWLTYDGRQVMEKRLGQLVKAHHKSSKSHPALNFYTTEEPRDD